MKGKKLPKGQTLLERRHSEGARGLTGREVQRILRIQYPRFRRMVNAGEIRDLGRPDRPFAIWSIESVSHALEGKLKRRAFLGQPVPQHIVCRISDLTGLACRKARRLVDKCELEPFRRDVLAGSEAVAMLERAQAGLHRLIDALPVAHGDALIDIDSVVIRGRRNYGVSRGRFMALVLSGDIRPAARKGEARNFSDLLFLPSDIDGWFRTGGLVTVRPV